MKRQTPKQINKNPYSECSDKDVHKTWEPMEVMHNPKVRVMNVFLEGLMPEWCVKD